MNDKIDLNDDKLRMAREASALDDFSRAISRLAAEAKAAGKTDFGSLAVRAEDLKTVLGYEAAVELLDDSMIARIQGAVTGAGQRGGSHASIDSTILEGLLRKVDKLATKAAA